MMLITKCACAPLRQTIGPQPYPVIYAVVHPVRGHKEDDGQRITLW